MWPFRSSRFARGSMRTGESGRAAGESGPVVQRRESRSALLAEDAVRRLLRSQRQIAIQSGLSTELVPDAIERADLFEVKLPRSGPGAASQALSNRTPAPEVNLTGALQNAQLLFDSDLLRCFDESIRMRTDGRSDHGRAILLRVRAGSPS